TIGHNITTCKWLQEKLVADPKNKTVKEVVVSKPQYVAKIKSTNPGPSAKKVEEVERKKVADLVTQQDLDAAQQENHNENIHDNAAAQDTSACGAPCRDSIMSLAGTETEADMQQVDDNAADNENADMVPETQDNVEV
ncbi:hypothetical protein A2U01_0049314, partial [Trifolium medium]|nr:hypothetical protein [Trifolium medium]